MELVREADNGHSLARLKPMNQVGGKADTCGGPSTDTAFLVGDGAEGVEAVKDCRSGWNQAFLTQLQRRKKGLIALLNAKIHSQHSKKKSNQF